MAPSKPIRARTLTVKRTYEPTRIAAACLADAYSRVVPHTDRRRRAARATTDRPSSEDHLAERRKPNEPA